MNINIVDIIIVLYILICGIVGYKRGVLKELVICLGTIAVFFIAYKLKNPIAEFLLLRMPMFDFPNLFTGVATLNILVYQLLSFVIVLAILLIVYNLILSLTGLFEKLLRITVVLGVFSKILGFIVGLIEGYVVAFVILFFLSQPAFSFELFMDSKLSNTILNSSPVLTNFTSDTVEVIGEIYELKDEKDPKIVNAKSLDLMLKNGVVKYDLANELYKRGKLNFDGIEAVLEKYKDKK